MPSLSDQKDSSIALVSDCIQKRYQGEDAKLLQQFSALYFAEGIAAELLKLSSDQLYGAIHSLWNTVKFRTPNAVNVRVYNPSLEDDHWHTSHTVIDVVCDDKAFLVSSITNCLTHLGHTIHMTTHPVVAIERAQKGKVTNISPFTGKAESEHLEAVMRFEIDQVTGAHELNKIATAIESVIQDVGLAVQDWSAMRHKLVAIIDSMANKNAALPNEILNEQIAFLQWLANNHFTFIGYRVYALSKDADTNAYVLTPKKGSGLGTLRDENCHPHSLKPIILSEQIAALALNQDPLVMTKSAYRSSVHRPVNFDYLGLKQFNESGQVIGEERFYGLYSSAAYTARIDEIPLLRRKASAIRSHIEQLPNSHKGKALQHVLNSYPRDEMLQASVEELYPIIQGVLQTQERHQLRLFMRFDAYEKFATALVYVPREKFNTDLRIKMQQILMQELDALSVDFNVMFSEQPMARVQLTVHGNQINHTDFDQQGVQAQMEAAMLSWNDHLHQALNDQYGEEKGKQLLTQYNHAFPLAYQERFSAQIAVVDLASLQKIDTHYPLITHLYQPDDKCEGKLAFKVLGYGKAKALSQVLPILERMGVTVINAHPYAITTKLGIQHWIIDFDIEVNHQVDPNNANLKERFQNAFNQVYLGTVNNDRFNSLVLTANLTWQQAVLMRAINAYLQQIQVPFSQTYIQSALIQNANITQLLVQLFEARFDPNTQNRGSLTKATQQAINKALDEVSNLDEDRILKYFLALIMAMLRTNYYQHDENGHRLKYLAYKIDPSLVPGVPLPLPQYEIFVYSTWVEGVHLRGGKVARGGLRWSDRKEDYRTEVLGLVKAQMVKNAVIVPVGAKGGFVCKALPDTDSREELMNAVKHSYSTFIQALLDITDNIVDKAIAPPQNLVRYDDDDPYLVVAADKGTATFSDLANSISEKNSFWLGDAFASGGENGYDHKKMGITARGAWESVKRLFLEQGRDCQSQDISVVGVGDMAGDVFGNGMLLSKHICLQAAFNHLHIFIDPNPDAASSFKERERLFAMPRSSWQDYNQNLISKGGGIYDRFAKSITLTQEIQKMLGTSLEKMTPNELIHCLLKMPVDLFWNGGIGTYVKASTENHVDVGDPANDSLRVNGCELGAKVVGEGGNLGFSQLGRIEFSRAGGFINTDAIDNSGGVDSSDHEVNIKILLSQLVDAKHMSLSQRNKLLASMTDEVGELVIKHNFHQSLVLSIALGQASDCLSDHKRLIHSLEQQGRLNRAIEGLPSDASIDELARSQSGLTRPELAVLLAYSKMYLFDELMASNIGDDPYLADSLKAYFPKKLSQDYPQAMASHPLRNEIIATHLTNKIGNRMGATFGNYVKDEVGACASDMARAFTGACDILHTKGLWTDLDKVTLNLPYSNFLAIHERIQLLLESVTLWLLSHHQGESIQTMVDLYKQPLAQYTSQLSRLVTEDMGQKMHAQATQFLAYGFMAESSLRLSQLELLYHGLDIARIAAQCETDVISAAKIWYALHHKLQGHWLNQAIAKLPSQDPWQRKAKASLKHEFENSLAQLTQTLINHDQSQLEVFVNQDKFKHCLGIVGEIQTNTNVNLAMLSVAVNEITKLNAN